MSDTVQTAMYDILKSIQAELAGHRARFDHIEVRLDKIEGRLGMIEDVVRKQRRDTAGLLVMAKAVTGNFAEEVALLKERMSALESRFG